MNDPDWGRYLVDVEQKLAKVGDPTLWGNRVSQIFRPYVDRFFSTQQIIQVQALDRYPRSWTIIGELVLESLFWNFNSSVTPGPGGQPFPAGTDFMIWLEVMQGTGQVQLTQQILLMAGRRYGLCNTQCCAIYDGTGYNGVPQGGPYVGKRLPSFQWVVSPEARAFAAVGALVGNTISARLQSAWGDGVGYGGPATSALQIALQIVPHAPGAGL